jgi:hypothetical protein
MVQPGAIPSRRADSEDRPARAAPFNGLMNSWWKR